MYTVAIIAAAGKGKRFKSKVPKQYVDIEGIPLLYYTLSIFNSSPVIDGIVLVSDRRVRYNFEKLLCVVKGGETRAHSVYNGLKVVPKGTDIVVVHDGVRPFVKEGLIEKVVKAAKRYGAAICAVPCKNTIKEVTRCGFVKRTLDRNSLVEVQTPQAFRYDLLIRSYKRFDITDDSSLIKKVKVVPGDYANIKITTREDLVYIRGQIQHKVGIGYDIHRLVKGRRLILGGVDIPGGYGLDGHSDADVLLHAITDAMFGAIGERDIGWHFPNTSPNYKDMDSSYFLLMAKEMLKEKGYSVEYVDSVVIAQEPRLQPYYMDMVRNISKWLGADVTIKFTTPEKLGPLGHKKAIASMAIVGIKSVFKV